MPHSGHAKVAHESHPSPQLPGGRILASGATRATAAREDTPAETGWNHHHSIWNYNAAFVAEVYLWPGMKRAAHSTFIGYLNHASPQYCWREEQPLQDAMVLTYVGDMPHNWASAECTRYLRHMLALEDGARLRLLAGITAAELTSDKPYSLAGTPTRFGRLNLSLEPLDGNQGWRLHFERQPGAAPAELSLPAMLGSLRFNRIEGALSRPQSGSILVDPAVSRFTAFWQV